MNRHPYRSLEEEYKGESSSFSLHKALQAFQHILGLPPGMLRTEFKEYAKKVVEKNHPAMKCSAARMVLEGRLSGIPLPFSSIHPGWRFRVNTAFLILDLFETIIQDWLEESLREAAPEIRVDLEELDGVLGTNRVSALLELLETLDAEQDEETSPSHAGSRSGQK
jgi:hypothetical protein